MLCGNLQEADQSRSAWICRGTMPLNRRPMIGEGGGSSIIDNQILISYLRCHRIGQDKPVHVKRLVVENTIEERCDCFC